MIYQLERCSNCGQMIAKEKIELEGICEISTHPCICGNRDRRIKIVEMTEEEMLILTDPNTIPSAPWKDVMGKVNKSKEEK